MEKGEGRGGVVGQLSLTKTPPPREGEPMETPAVNSRTDAAFFRIFTDPFG